MILLQAMLFAATAAALVRGGCGRSEQPGPSTPTHIRTIVTVIRGDMSSESLDCISPLRRKYSHAHLRYRRAPLDL